MFPLRNKKGQSLLEYALILGAIIVGILFMQLYVRRAIEGRLRDSSDSIGDQYDFSATLDVTTNRNSLTTEVTSNIGEVTTYFNQDDRTRTGNEVLPAFDNAWPSW